MPVRTTATVLLLVFCPSFAHSAEPGRHIFVHPQLGADHADYTAVKRAVFRNGPMGVRCSVRPKTGGTTWCPGCVETFETSQ